MFTQTEEFKGVKIKLASPETILEWSHGEVTKPETINYVLSVRKKMVCLMKRFSVRLRTGNVIAVSTSAFATKILFVISVALKLPKPLFAANAWATSIGCASRAHLVFARRAFPNRFDFRFRCSGIGERCLFAAYIITSVDEEAAQAR
jgi:hypothetical protein